MRQLQPVLWTKGLVLSPQHLQTQDRFFEDNLGFQLSALSPWHWGFQQRAFDADALSRGELVIVEATGALPDGTVFAVPESDGRISPRGIASAWIEDTPTLTAYLALPETRSDGRNVAMLGEDVGTRFVADSVRRRDENNGLAERELQVARKNLRIVFESETLEGFTSLPFIRLVRTPTGEFVEDPSFIPPLLSTAGSPRLQALVERLVELLAARSASLLSQRRAGHPGELYESMLGLAGSLTTFSTAIDSRDFPAYVHADPGPPFLRMEELIRTLVEKAVPETCVALALRQVDQTTYAASIDDERLLRPVGVYLAVRSDVAASELIRQVPLLLKVSSADRVPGLIRQALPGARLTYASTPPSAVPLRLDSQYFEVTRSGDEWESVLRSRNFAAHVPSELGRVTLELIVLLPQRT
jgi:type VI secretion system protein ImpJ